MFQPSWRGKYNFKNGLYYSNNKHIRKDTNTDTDTNINTNTNTDTDTNTNTDIDTNTNTNTDIDTNTNTNTDIDTNTNTNTDNCITNNIPYYNKNIEYLKNNIDNQNKEITNYFNLLDRIGYISRYLLKGNDYYKLYISKNSNKYFENESTSVSESVSESATTHNYTTIINDSLNNTNKITKNKNKNEI